MGTFKSIMNRWRTGDFFRQLATVVIGIMITFGGSALIQRGAQRREARKILTMVRDELNTNMEGLREYRDYFQSEIDGCRALAPWIVKGVAEEIPLDTLERYRSVLVSVSYFIATDNSFETLKSSPVIGAVADSELVNAVFEIYEMLEAGAAYTERFFKPKWDGAFTLLQNLDVATMNGFFTPEGLREAFARIATHDSGKELRYHIVSLANGNNNYQVDLANEYIARIERVVQMIEKEL